ncbi:MAG TPA: hypothetical protein K8W20_12240 [Pseudomonas lactis]|uniref:Uncharacterized protein n=1 Tax=Pseudomonas lactis TaxID=1615674 RepID=A0A921T7P4_9PSED|nr:hypothetical protein [Pseudomonas lactis]HJH19471.1 hypothetical protein [Pseudomonas lactis]
MISTESPPLTIVLDSEAQAALSRSQAALLAWKFASFASNEESGKLWEARVATALEVADLVGRLVTIKQISAEMDKQQLHVLRDDSVLPQRGLD